MARILRLDEFAQWLTVFLPGIESGEPAALFTPVVVSDSGDGAVAHLHGLNASRAWCWRRLAETLPDGDPRIEAAVTAARRHAAAALPHVVGDDYMVEHWLVAYAVLMLS
jgi:TctA family transporter